MNERVIVITGAAGQLGCAVAECLTRHGCRLALVDQTPMADQGGPQAQFCLGEVDASDARQASDTIERIAAHFGRLDGLVNVAGTFRWQTVAQGDVDTWDALYRINLRTAVCMTQAALPHLKVSKGRIVNIAAGVAVQKAATGMAAYAASKAGVVKLTESLADEVKDCGMTVNAILPSIIDTPANRRDLPDADYSRWVQPSQIADLVVFLLSPQSSAINGALIPIAGRV